MQWFEVLSIVNVAGLVALFFRSYLAEKGKNLATKEDVEHITRLVEAVKSEYSLDIERYKTSLLVAGQTVDRRRNVYEEVSASLRVFVGGHAATPEAKERFHNAYAAAWLWASDEVLASLNIFLEQQVLVASRGAVTEDQLKQAYGDIVVRMRKDVGFASTALVPHEYRFVRFGSKG